jgi:coenzyme F420 hydrogenase subunit beta
MKITKLDDIVEAGLCAGCGICESIAGGEAVEMKLAPNGRIRPHCKTTLDSPTFDQIMQVCPGVTVTGPAANASCPAHPVWGPIVSLHRGWASDEKTRFHAAAGGALTALGMYLLRSGKVDTVLHIEASSEIPALSNTRVSTTEQEVYHGAQSRYGPGASLTEVHRLLQEGRIFAVIGKPCDINAIRNLQQTSARARKQIPYCLSIFCGGTMSLNALDAMAEHFAVAPDELSLFRYRGEGWPGTAHMETRDGREFDLTYEQAWLDDHVPWKYDLQFRCKICPDAIGETADISCPDGWVMKDGKPLYEEAPGINLVIARTRAGEDLIREAESAEVLTLEPFSIAQLDEMHDDHRNRKTHWPARMLGLRLTGQPAVRVSGYRLIPAFLAAGLSYSLKSLWGTFHRARKGLNRETGFSE